MRSTVAVKRRQFLSACWLIFFVMAFALVEGLVWIPDSNGFHYILPAQRVDHLLPIIQFYAPIIGGILAFWFVRPFKPASTDSADRFRFRLAVAVTAIFNAIVVLLLGSIYVHAATLAIDVIEQVRNIGVASCFLVGGINFYYFGAQL